MDTANEATPATWRRQPQRITFTRHYMYVCTIVHLICALCVCVCADKCRSLNVYVALIEAKVSVASI